jgi:hypothetical protein
MVHDFEEKLIDTSETNENSSPHANRVYLLVEQIL